MRRVTTATYQDGVLKPTEKLPFADHEQVLIIVVPLPNASSSTRPNLDRVNSLQEQAEAWLRQQLSTATRPRLDLTQSQEQGLDVDLDAALGTIRARASRFSVEEIAADIEAALGEVRRPSAGVIAF